VRSGDGENRILVSAPMETLSGPNRNNLAIWSSLDEGVTFSSPHQLDYGTSIYLVIVTLNAGSIVVIYKEIGNTLLKFLNR